MTSTPKQSNGSNPRKRRRLNNNLATTDRMQVMMGIEKRKVKKVKQELEQAMMDKDAALKQLCEIKSQTISKLKQKNGEMTNLQDKLQTIFDENKELKQKNNTLKHKLEISQSQISSLEKENFKLRAQKYNKSQTKSSNTTVIPTANGHLPPVTNTKFNTLQIEYKSLQKELELKNKSIASQTEEILRLEQEIQSMDANNGETNESLKAAAKHIARLQSQLAQKSESQTDFAQSEMENIRHKFERKIRLLEDNMRHYKTNNDTLKMISEEHEVLNNKHTQLKQKYMQLMQLNTKYEPVYMQLNEWKKIIRSMCYTLFPDAEHLLDNEYQLKVALKNMNEKYISLVQQRDEYRSNLTSIKDKWIHAQKELSEHKLAQTKQMEANQNVTQKLNDATKELNQCKIESQSYKNVLNTYNAMSPSAHSEKQHIKNLFEENQKLMEKIKMMENETKRFNKQLEQIEIENAKLAQRVNNGEYNSLNTKVLNMKNNPLKMAQDRMKNADKQKIKMMEAKMNDLENKLEKMKQIKNKNGNNNESMMNDKTEIYYELENEFNILVKKMSIKEKEIEQIKDELKSAKKINQRMKSLFGKKAGEYRERIYQMTGYNICLLGDGKHYRIQHLWMECEEDEIILQINKLGQLQLKDTEFMRKKMDKGLLKKLQKTRSLPIFFSELTLWLYKDT